MLGQSHVRWFDRRIIPLLNVILAAILAFSPAAAAPSFEAPAAAPA